MYLFESMQNIVQRYEKQIAMLEEKISAMPEGVLHISRNGDYCTWRVSYPDGRRVYLPKRESELAKALALKRFYMAKLHDLKAELEACSRYVRYKTTSVSALEKFYADAGEEFRNLLGFSFESPGEKAAAWENATYEKNDKFPEKLNVPTLKKGEKVRSKIEASFAGSLFTHRIPYRYEQMLVLGGRKVAVDFMVLDIRTFQEIPVEIFGMMDNQEYRQHHNKKIAAYINSGYIPGVNFLTFYDTSASPLGLNVINKTLEDFFFNNPPIRI